jgi:Domain of unknown function (DUF4382)
MQRIMLRRAFYGSFLAGLAASLAACGSGGGGSGSSTSTSSASSQTTVAMPLTMSDAPSDDWACVGVRVLSIALVPASGGTPVTVWTAPSPAPYVNLVQLDQLGEILGNVSVPPGTYASAILTIAANPGDVLLTTAADPESGFPVAGGTVIPSDEIQIQHAQGSSGNLTVAVTVKLVSDLTVSTTSSNALDLEFDLGHPAFIVAHTPPAGDGATLWAVNFNAPLRHLPVHDLTRLVLRHTYGTVSAVASGSLTVTKDFPVYPPTDPETAIAGTQSLTIDADGTYGTIVYDLDVGTRTVVENFTGESSLNTKYVRVAARYQEGGTLVAVRVWASTDFNKVWLSPEGHVLNVSVAPNDTTATITVTNELGQGVPVTVNGSTEFFFRTPAKASADAMPIGTGVTFLANQDLVRGFKVHVSSMDPLAVPMVADTVDIETAAFGGQISNANTGGFTYTTQYLAANDDYSLTLGYIASTTDNGFDDSDNLIQGFKWWNFTYPTTVVYGADAIAQFVAATNGAVNLGGTVGQLVPFGLSRAMWGDGGTVNLTNWYLRDAVLVPTPLPLGDVTTNFDGSTFAMTVAGGTQPLTVNVSTTPGSATLVYQVNRSDGIVTVTPVDITGGGLAMVEAALVSGAPVRVYGVPVAPAMGATAGTLNAYVLTYFTGTMPGM